MRMAALIACTLSFGVLGIKPAMTQSPEPEVRIAFQTERVETFDELHPRFLLAAAFMLGLTSIGLRRPTELVWQAASVGAAVPLLATLL